MTPRSNIARSVAAALVLALLTACASAPTQEMSDARQSLQAAHDAGAEDYAGENLDNAQDYLERAERELELRYFGRARHDAIVARSEALKAHNVALAIKAAETAIKAAPLADAEVAELQALLDQAIEAARRGHDREAVRLATAARKRAESATDAQ